MGRLFRVVFHFRLYTVFLIEFCIQVSLKDDFCVNLCMNCVVYYKSNYIRICSFLNRGSVCELYGKFLHFINFVLRTRAGTGPNLDLHIEGGSGR